MKTDASLVRVRDVVHNAVHQLPRDLSMLRVPYDFFTPTAAVEVRDGLATFHRGTDVTTGRVASACLGDAQPGERVLLQLPPSTEGEWWLCEVEESNGVMSS